MMTQKKIIGTSKHAPFLMSICMQQQYKHTHTPHAPALAITTIGIIAHCVTLYTEPVQLQLATCLLRSEVVKCTCIYRHKCMCTLSTWIWWLFCVRYSLQLSSNDSRSLQCAYLLYLYELYCEKRLTMIFADQLVYSFVASQNIFYTIIHVATCIQLAIAKINS